MLLKNPQISAGPLHIRSKIIPRETTGHIPFTESVAKNNLSDIKDVDFFEDDEIKGLFSLETLFTNMNETDEKILRLLAGVSAFTKK